MARPLIYTEMYDKDIKNRFLDEHSYSEKSKERYGKLFKRVFEFEDRYKKDLFDFSTDEIINVLYGLESASKVSLNSVLSLIRSYIKWAKNEAYSSNLVDVTELIDINSVAQMTSRIKIRKQYLSGIDELEDLVQSCDNKQDGALFILLYFGIRKQENELDELIDLKISDCNFDKNVVKLSNRDINIPPCFMEYLHDAADQTIYVLEKSGKTKKGETSQGNFADHDLIETGCLIKKAETRAYNGIDKMSYVGIMGRFKRVAVEFGKPLLNPNNVFYSGMFYQLNEIEKQHELTTQDLLNVRHMYNLFDDKNASVLKDKYVEWKNAMAEQREIAAEIEKAKKEAEKEELQNKELNKDED